MGISDLVLSKFLLTLLVPIVLLVVGTLAYHFLEGMPLSESLYLTVMTVTTVVREHAFQSGARIRAGRGRHPRRHRA